MNPKSIWIIFPFLSMRIFPLCLSLIWRIYWTREHPTKELTKFFLFVSKSLKNIFRKLWNKLGPQIFFKASMEMESVKNSIIPLEEDKGKIWQVLIKVLMLFSSRIFLIRQMICMAIISCLRSSPPLMITGRKRWDFRPRNFDLFFRRFTWEDQELLKIESWLKVSKNWQMSWFWDWSFWC